MKPEILIITNYKLQRLPTNEQLRVEQKPIQNIT